MRILNLLVRFISLPYPTRHAMTQAHVIDSRSQLVYSLTQPTQPTPLLLVEAPSVTALATMPCTPFPGRERFDSPSTLTFHFSTSIAEVTERPVLRRRLEKKYAVSTYGMDDARRDIGVVTEVIVEWLVLCAWCWAEMDRKD